MLTELNTKYDIVSNHIKRIDVQLAQTAESVKRQQGMLPGKTDNPRIVYCNATKLRCEKAEGKEPEKPTAETTPGAEERTEHPASSEVTAPGELAETLPVRIYVHVGEKYSGIEFLQTPGRTPASGSPLEGTPIPRIPAGRNPGSQDPR